MNEEPHFAYLTSRWAILSASFVFICAALRILKVSVPDLGTAWTPPNSGISTTGRPFYETSPVASP